MISDGGRREQSREDPSEEVSTAYNAKLCKIEMVEDSQVRGSGVEVQVERLAANGDRAEILDLVRFWSSSHLAVLTALSGGRIGIGGWRGGALGCRDCGQGTDDR